MPFTQGQPGGPGRPKGAPNKRTEELMDALRAAGMNDGDNPAVFLYGVYSGRRRFERYIDGMEINPDTGELGACQVKVLEPASEQVRVQAAVACAKYVHPALKAVELTGADGAPLVPMFAEDFRGFMGAQPETPPPARPLAVSREPRPSPPRRSRAARVE